MRGAITLLKDGFSRYAALILPAYKAGVAQAPAGGIVRKMNVATAKVNAATAKVRRATPYVSVCLG